MRPQIRAAVVLSVVFAIGLAAAARAEEHPVRPYVAPAQLDVPWPKHSDYRQPWRAFLETRSGAAFLQGIGINYNVPGNEAGDELAVRLLAESGFKTFRIEVGWGSVKWDESGINGAERFLSLLRLCKQYGIRPTMLLNANHGVPCPTRFFEKKLAADAAKGDRSIKLADSNGIVAGYSGLNNLSPHSYWACEAIITSVNPGTGVCQLSKPLPADLKTDEPVKMATLKYLPFYPVGTPQFEETVQGWLKYAALVTGLVAEAGIDDFDVELWNELSFGSNFTNIDHYYDPPIEPKAPNFLLPGGSAWELSRRTTEAVKKDHPGARIIWGWSNTTFYHCPIEKLPPGIDGQSYHPYGTGTRTLPKDEDQPAHPEFNIEGYIPAMEIRMPEGWAHEFLKTECLMRLLNPQARQQHPEGTQRFYHYMTEHGVAPPECGITDDAGAWRIKTLCALRSYCLWLNKGVDVLDYFCAWEKKPDGMGLLPPDLARLPADAKFEEVATPPMKAVRNLTRAFAGSEPVAADDQKPLEVDVVELEGNRKTFDGDATHPPLYERDSFAFLPWQTGKGRYVAAVYVMTYDATKPMPPTRYRLTIEGMGGEFGTVTLYDPIQDAPVEVKVLKKDKDKLEVEVPVVDYPRLLTMSR
jgi:hypothetical protein